MKLIWILIVFFTLSTQAYSKPAYVKRGTNGKPVVMCWTAPAQMWTTGQALNIAIKKAPKGINKGQLVDTSKTASEHIYIFLRLHLNTFLLRFRFF